MNPELGLYLTSLHLSRLIFYVLMLKSYLPDTRPKNVSITFVTLAGKSVIFTVCTALISKFFSDQLQKYVGEKFGIFECGTLAVMKFLFLQKKTFRENAYACMLQTLNDNHP